MVRRSVQLGLMVAAVVVGRKTAGARPAGARPDGGQGTQARGPQAPQGLGSAAAADHVAESK